MTSKTSWSSNSLLFIICCTSWSLTGVCVLTYVQHGGMWWRAWAWQDVCVSGQSLQGRAPKLHTRPKSQSSLKAIGLTAHVIEPAKPRRPRALTEEQSWRGAGVWLAKNEPGISFVRLLMSVTSTILFSLRIWWLDPQWNIFTVRVRGTGFTWHSKW